MHQVEEMCGRILLMDHGSACSMATWTDIRRQFSSNAVQVTLRARCRRAAWRRSLHSPAMAATAAPGAQPPGSGTATSGTATSGNYHLLLEDGVAPEAVLKRWCKRPP
jgi:ABC-type multidrug transport system ATPase subunit